MIVQCEAYQTRFRLADEKVKAGGTKVRCSKCKEVFTVMPPEPEPVEEAVDFGSFNMEPVADDVPPGTEAAGEDLADKAPEPKSQEEVSAPTTPPAEAPQETAGDLDFNDFEADTAGADTGTELADDFAFGDTSNLADQEEASTTAADFSTPAESPEDSSFVEPPNFDDAFSETAESDEGMDFDFNEEPAADFSPTAANDEIDFSAPSPTATDEFDFSAEAPAAADEIDFSSTEPEDASALSFDDEQADSVAQDGPVDFSFGDESEDNAFAFGDTEEEATAPATAETAAADEFSFDNENPFGDDSSSEWSDDTASEGTSFDFEEPQFDTNQSPAESPAAESGDDGLQFGEIDFAGDSSEDEAPGFASDDFSQASMEEKEEPESFSQAQESPKPPADDYDDEEPLPAPPPQPKKSSLSRILTLLVLLLVILGGAAGFLFVQEGTVNLNTIGRYLPILQEYIGEAPVSSPGDRIGINVTGSSYVKGTEGQLLVIQGAAVNNHPATRSAITIKGVLVDAQGKTLLQQTVFCGNQMNDEDLKSKPFAAIEEAMNNQFGDSLSNMNVAAGTSIPFTIVFRNLPDGIASINVEVVDSKPGAG